MSKIKIVAEMIPQLFQSGQRWERADGSVLTVTAGIKSGAKLTGVDFDGQVLTLEIEPDQGIEVINYSVQYRTLSFMDMIEHRWRQLRLWLYKVS